MELSVIIPAHNEAENITNALEKIAAHLSKKRSDYEIIVSEDGSTDNTFALAKKIARKNKHVRIIHSARRLGKGGGIIKGFKAARGDVIAFIDADLASGPTELEKVVNAVLAGNDLAIASRHMGASRIMKDRPLLRRLAAKGMNILANTMFDLQITDTQCGLKAISKSALKKIIPELTRSGFEFDVELILRAKQAGMKIKEVPIIWEHRQRTSKIPNLPISTVYNVASGLTDMWIRNSFNKQDVLFFLFLLLFITAASAIIGRTIDPDEGTHLAIGAFYYNFIHDYLRFPTLSFSKIYNYAIAYLVHYPKLSLYYPPGFYIVFASFGSLFGLSAITGAATGLMFGALALLSIYFFGLKFVSKNSGIIAATFFILTPPVLYLSVRAMLDISYLFFFILSLIFYLIAMHTGKNRHFVFAALLFGVGFLFKQNIAVLVPIVFLYSLFVEKKHFKKVIISFLIAAILIAPYLIFLYKSGLLDVLLKSSLRVTGMNIGAGQLTLQGLTFYLQQFAEMYLSYPLLFIALIALAFYCFKKEKYWKLFLIWFLSIYIIFSLIPNKQGRYLLPAVPALLFPISFYISRLPRKILALTFVSAVALLLYTSYLTLPSGFYYNTSYAAIATTVLNKNGNVLLYEEQQPWFYSSAFTFEMMRLDSQKSHSIFRPCSLEARNLSELIKQNGIRYILSTDSFLLPALMNSFSETNMSSASVYLYENSNYGPQKENCNYICVTNQWVCSKYAYPADALR